MSSPVHYFARTECGPTRNNNEDSWTADEALGLYVVADGMGGLHAGEVASRLVVENLPRFLDARLAGATDAEGHVLIKALEDALRDTNQAVCEHRRNEPIQGDMGSTAVCAWLRNGKLVVAHVGDSRAYRYADHTLLRLTTDHTMAQILLDNDLLTEEESRTDDRRNQLTQFMGLAMDQFNPSCREQVVAAGDILLLCSDGLTTMVSEVEIANIMDAWPDIEALGNALVQAAMDAGGYDNVTVLLLTLTTAAHADNEAPLEGLAYD